MIILHNLKKEENMDLILINIKMIKLESLENLLGKQKERNSFDFVSIYDFDMNSFYQLSLSK
jgi:hypothetical protein